MKNQNVDKFWPEKPKFGPLNQTLWPILTIQPRFWPETKILKSKPKIQHEKSKFRQISTWKTKMMTLKPKFEHNKIGIIITMKLMDLVKNELILIEINCDLDWW